MKTWTLYGKKRTEAEHLAIVKACEMLGETLFPSFIISGFDPGVHFHKLETHLNFSIPLSALIQAGEAAKIPCPEALLEFRIKEKGLI